MGGILEMQGAIYNGMPKDGRYLGNAGSNFDTDIHSCLSYKSRTQDKNTSVKRGLGNWQ